MLNDLPETLTLYPSKLKWLGILALACGFVAIAVFVMQDAPPHLRALVGGFFGLGIPVALLQIFGKGSWLRLDQDGFQYAQFGKKHAFGWHEVSEFGVWKMKQGFFTTSSHVGFSTEADSARTLGKINTALVGATGTLPDTYGKSAKDLAELMNAFRDRALGA